MNSHPDLTPLLGEAAPTPAQRRELLAHLAGCAVCRASVAERDPSVLFSLLALEPVPESVLARVSLGATDGIARESRRVSSRRIYALGSLAASLLLAAFVGIYLWGPGGGAEAPARPVQVVDVESKPTADVVPAGFFEMLDSPGSAEVVNLSMEELDFVMIFDTEFGI